MKNSTITSQEFQFYKEGYSFYGRNDNGTCIDKTSSNKKEILNYFMDHPLKFRQNTLYACNQNFTFNEFYTFCTKKKWQDLAIFNLHNDIKFLGKYGSSELAFKSVKII